MEKSGWKDFFDPRKPWFWIFLPITLPIDIILWTLSLFTKN